MMIGSIAIATKIVSTDIAIATVMMMKIASPDLAMKTGNIVTVMTSGSIVMTVIAMMMTTMKIASPDLAIATVMMMTTMKIASPDLAIAIVMMMTTIEVWWTFFSRY
jgi:hypothetical protein